MSAAERQLAQRIARGDRAAFEEFLDGYGPRVQRLVRRYAVSEADVEDLMQEIFIDIYRGIAGFRGDSALSTWVYRVALNHCLRHGEKEKRRPTSQNVEAVDEPTDASTLTDPARQTARGEL